MPILKIYYDDLQIAKSLMNRDEKVTRMYFYKQYYPLFKSIYDNYQTDCESCLEFINDIYLLVLSPSSKTGKCQLENYRGESTLATWLKTVCIFYCYKKFEKKEQMPICQELPYSFERYDNGASDRYEYIYGTIDLNFDSMNREDVEVLLKLMPNARYRDIIRMLYLECKSHKDVAVSLGMSMDNYYNKRILAEKQFKAILRKEANHG